MKHAVFWAPLVLLSAAAMAEETSSSPYIDSIRQEMKDKGQPTGDLPRDAGAPDPYIQSIKQKAHIEGGAPAEESYTEQIKKDLGLKPSESYTEQQKSVLGPSQEGGAIQALKEGHSDLRARKVGDIHNAMGLRVGASMKKDITSASGLQAFDSVYGDNFPLDLSLFYEYQPWHSEWFGNIGIFTELGVSYFHGNGAFQFQVHNADSGGNFGGTSGTNFQFFTAPITVGLDYRFNLFRLFRPFVKGGGTVAGFYESRNDGGDTHTAVSTGFFMGGGVNVLLDWISPSASWDLYAEHSVKHYYLTIDYTRIQTVSGDVHFTVSGIYGGLAFEF